MASRQNNERSLYDLHHTLAEEIGALRLIQNTLQTHIDVSIGQPVEARLAQDIGAAAGQLERAMRRIQDVADRIDELDTGGGALEAHS